MSSSGIDKCNILNRDVIILLLYFLLNRYEFPCKTWVPITRDISKKQAKVLHVKNVHEGSHVCC